jgi:hypothetical protein
MKTNPLFVITLLIGLLCHTQSFADNLPTVYGFKLGSPPDVLNCADDATKDLTKAPLIYYKVACFEKLNTPTVETLKIVFPDNETPSLAKGGSIYLSLFEGNIETISWSTNGVYDAENIMNSLIKKFGKPTQSQKTPVSNWKGQKFLEWSATWIRTGFVVNYKTIGELGNIYIF